ncbi:hypothetical protein SBOR_9495 [Sclerotinia borealis F-4128]|uniref:Uncharacterized protein n=1 Tax=Sclerotinia borealis (strain F-4128) TaxID=1432307 RepID=W9C2K2_SCLBF|nr:hypothetical protein SBOR_9495 [Sclerotinia borealis F-4128]
MTSSSSSSNTNTITPITSLPPTTKTKTIPSLPPNFTFAPSTLYILLADIGCESLFHWAYLLTSPPPPATTTPFLAPVTGTIFHITNSTPSTNSPSTPHQWTHQSPTIPLSTLIKFIPSLLFILHIQPIDHILCPALKQRLGVLGLRAQLRSLELMMPLPGGIAESEFELEGRLELNVYEPPELKERDEHKNANANANPNKPTNEKEKEITSKTWTKETLYTLDEEGYITFPETTNPKTVVDGIEAEAVAGAGWNRMRGTVGFEKSAWVGE